MWRFGPPGSMWVRELDDTWILISVMDSVKMSDIPKFHSRYECHSSTNSQGYESAHLAC